jgi:hypothetical protein
MRNAIRFRLLLPILLVAISMLLDRMGDSQMNRVTQANVKKYGFLEHPVPEDYAVARFIEYTFSAPAWLLSVKIPYIFSTQKNFRCCGFIRSEKDWEYLVLVAVMWYLIGELMDRHGVRKSRRVWLSYVMRCLLGCYGAYLCYSVTEFYQVPWSYPLWFVVPLTLWGLGIVFGAIYPFSPARSKHWYGVLGGFILLAGIFYIDAGARIYRYRSFFGASAGVIFFLCGVIAIAGSAYLFRRSMKAVRQLA